jgi:hypothetical protein
LLVSQIDLGRHHSCFGLTKPFDCICRCRTLLRPRT